MANSVSLLLGLACCFVSVVFVPGRPVPI